MLARVSLLCSWASQLLSLCLFLPSGWRQEGWSAGEKGWEAGEERAGSGSPKLAGTGANREKFLIILLYFAIQMGQRVGNHHRKGREAGVEDTGSWRYRR